MRYESHWKDPAPKSGTRAHLAYIIQISTTPPVRNIIPSHQVTMKADVVKFLVCYLYCFGTLEVMLSQNSGTKVMHGRYIQDFLIIQIAQVRSIFRTQKLVDENLGVSAFIIT